jgi:hypothetical protein
VAHMPCRDPKFWFMMIEDPAEWWVHQTQRLSLYPTVFYLSLVVLSLSLYSGGYHCILFYLSLVVLSLHVSLYTSGYPYIQFYLLLFYPYLSIQAAIIQSLYATLYTIAANSLQYLLSFYPFIYCSSL